MLKILSHGQASEQETENALLNLPTPDTATLLLCRHLAQQLAELQDRVAALESP